MSTVDNEVEYADARLVEGEELRVYHQLDHDPDERREHNLGIGVRVLVDGAWGFAAAPLADAQTPRRVAERALAVARAGAGAGLRVQLPPREPSSGSYATAVARRPVRRRRTPSARPCSTRRWRPCPRRLPSSAHRPASTPSASTATSPTPRARASTST